MGLRRIPEATEAPWLWPPSAAPAGAAGGRGNVTSGPLAEVLAQLYRAAGDVVRRRSIGPPPPLR